MQSGRRGFERAPRPLARAVLAMYTRSAVLARRAVLATMRAQAVLVMRRSRLAPRARVGDEEDGGARLPAQHRTQRAPEPQVRRLVG